MGDGKSLPRAVIAGVCELPERLMRIIVTGGSGGIGKVIADGLAAAGHTVLIGCRNTTEGERAAAQMSGDVDVGRLDLADLTGVRRFAESVTDVDVLINSAEVHGLPFRRTRDGFESHFAVNHLGHFALTCLLGDRIGDRVVVVSGTQHVAGHLDLDDLDWRRRQYSPAAAYAQSKLANALFADELARRGVPAYVADPGPAGDAQTSIAAVNTDLPKGSYLTPHVNQWGRRLHDVDLARRLWDVSVRLTGCDWRGETSGPLLW